MAVFSRVSMNEGRRIALPPRRAVQEQYLSYVRQLGPDRAGRLELGPDDEPITERARIKAAARAGGVTLEIHRQGNALLFWVSQEGPTGSVRRGWTQRSAGR